MQVRTYRPEMTHALKDLPSSTMKYFKIMRMKVMKIDNNYNKNRDKIKSDTRM